MHAVILFHVTYFCLETSNSIIIDLHIELFSDYLNFEIQTVAYTKRKQINGQKPSSTKMKSKADREKRVSFGESTNTVHLVENYKLSLDTPSQHKKVWYGPEEMHKFYEDECFYQQQAKHAAAIASKATSQPKRNSSSSRPRSRSTSPTNPASVTSSTRKELNQQQTQAIRNLRLAASMQYSNFLARNQQQQRHHNVHRIARPSSEALVGTRLPGRQHHHQRQRRRSHQPDIERVRAVFYSE